MRGLTRGALLVAHTAVLWPAVQCYAARTRHASEERVELVALAAACALVLSRAARGLPRGAPPLGLALALTLAYALCAARLPPFPAAAVAAAALCASSSALVFGRRVHVPLFGLAALALPVVPLLQYPLGLPLRVAVAAVAAPLLRIGGLPVERAGTALDWAGELVTVDPPCSGLRMLWAGLFVAFGLAAVLRLSNRRTLLVAGCAAALVLVANALRVAALFHLEAGRIALPAALRAQAHAGTGLALQAAVCALLLLLALRLARAAPAPERVAEREPERVVRITSQRGPLAFALACAVAAVAPQLAAPRAPRAALAAFPGWPESFEGRALERVPLSPREARFFAFLPGLVARFSDGERQLVLRWIAAPTLHLHPAADCFRGRGFEVAPERERVDSADKRWGAFVATRGAVRLRVRERVVAADRTSFADPAEWYWAALLGRTRGPWWSVLVAEPG